MPILKEPSSEYYYIDTLLYGFPQKLIIFLFLVDSTLIIFPVSHYFLFCYCSLKSSLRAFDSRKGISLNLSKIYIRVPGKLYRKDIYEFMIKKKVDINFILND